MKIKIITGSWWYLDKEGHVFDNYQLEGKWYIEKNRQHSVFKDHAIVIEDANYLDQKLPHLYRVLTDKYNLAVDKNTDYGNSFDKIMDKLVDHNIDPLQGLYIRLADKFNRFETLLFSDTQKVKDESIRDTLRDMSNYVDMYMAWEAKKDG